MEESFKLSKYIRSLNNIPRFGYSNNIAKYLGSNNPNIQSEYKDGIISFCIFLSTFALAWAVTLVVLKYYYGTSTVGFLAGGEVVNIRMMKKMGIRKSERKRRILRNWRIQTIFLVACCLIPMITFCFFQMGMDTFIGSLSDIQDVNDIVDSKAYLGLQITKNLIQQHKQLQLLLATNRKFQETPNDALFCPGLHNQQQNGLSITTTTEIQKEQQDTTTGAVMNQDTGSKVVVNNNNNNQNINDNNNNMNNVDDDNSDNNNNNNNNNKTKTGKRLYKSNEDDNFRRYLIQEDTFTTNTISELPSSTNTNNDENNISFTTKEELFQYIYTIQNQVQNEMSMLELATEQSEIQLSTILPILEQLTSISSSVDYGIDSIRQKDWISKLFLMLFNIFIAFFIVGVILTKHNVAWPAYQALLTYFMVPAFGMVLLIMCLGTCIFLASGIMNSDFCSGSTQTSSIQTFKDIMIQQGYNTNSSSYNVLDYYGGSCLSENPLSFIETIKSDLRNAHSAAKELYLPLQAGAAFSKNIEEECGSVGTVTLKSVNETIGLLLQTLDDMEGSLSAATVLTECSSLSPIFRRLMFGSACTSSVEGLTWLFATLLSMSYVGLFILTLRAALYNTLVRGRRQKKRELEWEDYKVFMSRFYDVSDWKLDHGMIAPADSLSLMESVENHVQLHHKPLQGTTPIKNEMLQNKESLDENDVMSCLSSHIDGLENCSQGTSYAPTVDENTTIEDAQSEMSLYFDGEESKPPSHQKVMAPPKDDDDDSYDSTYSTDSDEELGSVASSVASSFVRRLLLSRKKEKPLRDLLPSRRSGLHYTSSFSSSSSRQPRKPTYHGGGFDEGSVAGSASISSCEISLRSPSSMFETPKTSNHSTTGPSRNHQKKSDPLDLGVHKYTRQTKMNNNSNIPMTYSTSFGEFRFGEYDDEEEDEEEYYDDRAHSIFMRENNNNNPKRKGEMKPLSPPSDMFAHARSSTGGSQQTQTARSTIRYVMKSPVAPSKPVVSIARTRYGQQKQNNNNNHLNEPSPQKQMNTKQESIDSNTSVQYFGKQRSTSRSTSGHHQNSIDNNNRKKDSYQQQHYRS